ncbi:MAG: ATP-dependent DNA ligase, partial [Actinomycetota bacterium]
MTQAVELEVSGRVVTITNPDKVFFRARGDTKLDLVKYYLSVGDAIMRQMLDRPVMLQRFPNGAHGSNFFQKRIPEGAPDWLHTVIVRTPAGTASRALVIADLAHLVWAVNMGCLGFHSWAVRASDLDHCDELRIDLDPGPGTTYEMAQEAAVETKTLLDELGTVGFIKTSGNR